MRAEPAATNAACCAARMVSSWQSRRLSARLRSELSRRRALLWRARGAAVPAADRRLPVDVLRLDEAPAEAVGVDHRPLLVARLEAIVHDSALSHAHAVEACLRAGVVLVPADVVAQLGVALE